MLIGRYFAKQLPFAEPFLTDLKVHPVFDSLHGDPRFDDLVKRIGIPD